MEAFAYSLVDYSFLALSIGERLILLSMAGWLLVWLVARFFYRRGKGKRVAMAPLWLIYLLWLVPAASPFFPAMPQAWLLDSSAFGFLSGLMLDNPCAISPVERLGNSVFITSVFFSDRNLLLLLWCCISAVLFIRVCIQRAQFHARVRAADEITDPQIQLLLAQVRADFSIARAIRLCTSADYAAPFTMGVWHPVIFIPHTLLGQLTPQELKAVLAHECAHIARRDDLAVCWQQLVGVIFFFNPLLRYANRQLAQVREICCDHLAIRRCGFEPRVYARALVRVVEQLGAGVLAKDDAIPVPALLAQDLQLRLQSLINPNPQMYRWRPPISLLVSLLCVSFFLGGTGKPVAPVIEGEAVKALVTMPYVMPLAHGHITNGVHFHEPLGCYMPTREEVHAGIDFASAQPVATPVRAFADGVIESITTPPHNIGLMVRIAHAQGLQSTYVRLDQVNLPVGTRLSAGQVFASTGASPQTNHLHFELTQRGQILDAAALFND